MINASVANCNFRARVTGLLV